MAKLTKEELFRYRLYHRNGFPMQGCLINSIQVHRNGTLKHEAMKAIEAIRHILDKHCVITEAVRKSDNRRVDVVCLSCGEIEIANSSGSQEEYSRQGRKVKMIKV